MLLKQAHLSRHGGDIVTLHGRVQLQQPAVYRSTPRGRARSERRKGETKKSTQGRKRGGGGGGGEEEEWGVRDICCGDGASQVLSISLHLGSTANAVCSAAIYHMCVCIKYVNLHAGHVDVSAVFQASLFRVDDGA